MSMNSPNLKTRQIFEVLKIEILESISKEEMQIYELKKMEHDKLLLKKKEAEKEREVLNQISSASWDEIQGKMKLDQALEQYIKKLRIQKTTKDIKLKSRIKELDKEIIEKGKEATDLSKRFKKPVAIKIEIVQGIVRLNQALGLIKTSNPSKEQATEVLNLCEPLYAIMMGTTPENLAIKAQTYQAAAIEIAKLKEQYSNISVQYGSANQSPALTLKTSAHDKTELLKPALLIVPEPPVMKKRPYPEREIGAENMMPNEESWVPFFKKKVIRILKKEQDINVKLSVATNITPKRFNEICSTFKNHIQKYKDEKSGKEPYASLRCEAKSDLKTNTSYKFSQNQESLVEMVHFPSSKEAENKESGKVDIVLLDSKGQDGSLFLMVKSAKSVLEKIGKKEFNIENCERNPKVALKLYLIGLSMGLQPKFKDSSGETLEAIKKSDIKLKQGNRELNFEQIYKEIHNEQYRNNSEKIKQYIEKLEMKEEDLENKPEKSQSKL